MPDARPAKPLRLAIEQGTLVVDGAMGTRIFERGVAYGGCFEALNVLRPGLVHDIHEDYVRAGAQVIETNTFGANAMRLAAHGLGERVRELNLAAVAIARRAAGDRAYVAGAIGPSGKSLEGASPGELAAVKEALGEQARALVAAGVDALLLETVCQSAELVLGVEALVLAAAGTDVPIIASVSLDALGLMRDGTPALQIARRARDAGAHVVGVNCSHGPIGVMLAMEQMVDAGLPLFAAPSAGVPQGYTSTPADFGDFARRMVGLGVKMIGGCRGT